MNESLPIFWTCLGTLLVNIPFGYFRAGHRKLSFMWFLYIHLPVPFVIFIRYLNEIDLSWALAPFLFGSYFLGQWIGKIFRNYKDIRKQSIKEARINS
ncbi:MAG: hypothetical protein KAK04_23085 [Cyclobacteriaceae bacterium]|nr:hypothetical protein [Cyclobacteriaceae bacterium]